MVAVGLGRVRHVATVVADVSESVVIGVPLIGIGDRGARVERIRDSVTVRVGRRRDREENREIPVRDRGQIGATVTVDVRRCRAVGASRGGEPDPGGERSVPPAGKQSQVGA